MKTIANRLVMFAASAVVLGTMAYGQSEIQMKAEIPFAFRVAESTLPAGSYVFYRESSNGTMTTGRLFNAASHRSVAVEGTRFDSSHTASGSPSAVFVCGKGNQGCSLSEIRLSNGTLSYAVPQKAARDKEVSIALTPNAE
jgi:hypothetical protein